MRKITLIIILLALSCTGTISAANWYVATTGADTNDGSSGTPFLTIAKAITSAASGDVINIAAGTYQVTAALNPGDKTLTFQGAGKATTFIQANTDGTTTNALGVFANTTPLSAADRTYTFNDLTIKNSYPKTNGGGVNVSIGTTKTLTLVFTNVDFTNNQITGTRSNGSAIALNGNTNATFTNCKFSGNKAIGGGSKLSYGGAICANISGSDQSTDAGTVTLNIYNCYFYNNQTHKYGGAIHVATTASYNARVTVKNSTFVSNQCNTNSSSAAGKGGAISVTVASTSGTNSLWIENSTFSSNSTATTTAVGGGGAIWYSADGAGATNNLTINHCTITGNTVKTTNTGGDGICINSAGLGQTNLVMNNTIVIGNSGSTSNQSQVGTNAADQSKITNGGIKNCILGGAATSGTSGIVGTWITSANNNTLTAGTNDLAFGTITSDATPVLPIGNTSIARNYVSTNYLDPVLSTDQIGQSRVNATDAGAYENQLVQYTIAATAGTGGSIVSGAGNYDNGANCTLIAAANSGYSFVNWTEGGTEVSTNISYEFTVSGARTLVANFAASASPDLTLNTTSLTGFRYAPENGPSVEQSFLLTGANLTADVSITAPTNYEVSAISGTGFSSTAIISPSSGSLNNVPVYVRLKSGLTTNTAYNGETISVTTTGVSEQTVSCSGNITDALPATAATNAIATNTLHTTTDLSWTAGDGAKYLVLVSTNSDVASAYPPVAGTTYTAGNTTHTGYIVGYVGSATSANITGLTAGTTNYLAVFAFNDNTGSSGYENYLVSTPAETNVTTIAASATNDYFRTSTSGNWSSSNIWESSTDGISNWHLASLVPGASATSAVITAAGSPLTITSDIGRTGFSMQDGSSLVWNYAAALSKTIDANGTIGITASALQDYSPVITGASAINISLGVSSRQSAEWSGANFPANAQVNFSTSLGSADLGIESGTFSGKKVNLGANVKLLKATNEDAGGSTIISIGELSGASTSVINSGQVNGRTMAYNIGVLNTDATFAGQINNQDVSRILNINKVGTGNWTLSNANTGFTNGSFNVNAGTVTLDNGAGLGTVPVTVASGATLTGTGSIAGTTTVNGILGGSLNFGSAATLSSTATVNAGTTINMAAGAKLTADAGNTATIPSLVLNSNASGTATFVNNGSATVTSASVYQHLASARNWYISSPVTGATATVPSGYTFYAYDETGLNASRVYQYETAYWKAYPQGTELIAGKGYIAMATGETTLNFTGTLNDGDKAINLTRQGALKTGFNLVGNPYPSYLDAEALLTANSADVEANIWYRTHTGTAYQFQTYNASGNESVPIAANPSYIPPMQSFWVRALSNNVELNFSNTMRKHNLTAGSILLRAPKVSDVQRIRLQVSNRTNTDEALIYTNQNASNIFDTYDSRKMSNDNVAIPEIYTVINNENLVINGYNQLPLNEEITLGFKTGTANNFTIKASQITNIDNTTDIILKDKLLNTETILVEGAEYAFSSEVANTNTRFSLMLKSNTNITGSNNTYKSNFEVYTNANQQLVINSTFASFI